MKKEDCRIVYMGTPSFAVEPLRVLIKDGFTIVAVVTAPDKPSGRGQQVSMSAVKEFALSHQIKVLQPEKLKDPAFIEEYQQTKANLNIVVAFRMLPEVIWTFPSLGTFNLHASLLPQYRGAAPINWAIINGEKETGVTTFFIDKEIDTGKILFSEKLPILPEDNAGSLHDKLMFTGAKLVTKTAESIITGNVKAIDQSLLVTTEKELKAAPKLRKETCRINWDMPGENVRNFVRGLSPYPSAWTESKEASPVHYKIYDLVYEKCSPDASPGSIFCDQKKELKVAVKDGFMKIKELQAPGKKRMHTEDFLRGNKLDINAFN